MAIRRRQVHPDQVYRLNSGEELEVVSDEAYLAALLEVGRHQCFAGGTINGTLLRHPTDLEGEMVTIGAVIEWKDRTDARPQPEQTAPATAEPMGVNGAPRVVFEESDAQPAPAPAQQPVGGRGSGALPFQRDAPADPDEALRRVEEQLVVPPGARVERTPDGGAEVVGIQQDRPPAPVEVPAIEAKIAHDEAGYRPIAPPPGKTDDGVDDGLVVDENAVDEEAVPEHLR